MNYLHYLVTYTLFYCWNNLIIAALTVAREEWHDLPAAALIHIGIKHAASTAFCVSAFPSL